MRLKFKSSTCVIVSLLVFLQAISSSETKITKDGRLLEKNENHNVIFYASYAKGTNNEGYLCRLLNKKFQCFTFKRPSRTSELTYKPFASSQNQQKVFEDLKKEFEEIPEQIDKITPEGLKLIKMVEADGTQTYILQGNCYPEHTKCSMHKDKISCWFFSWSEKENEYTYKAIDPGFAKLSFEFIKREFEKEPAKEEKEKFEALPVGLAKPKPRKPVKVEIPGEYIGPIGEQEWPYHFKEAPRPRSIEAEK
jgi:hypothetical protein